MPGTSGPIPGGMPLRLCWRSGAGVPESLMLSSSGTRDVSSADDVSAPVVAGRGGVTAVAADDVVAAVSA